jgi:hypothetical protein
MHAKLFPIDAQSPATQQSPSTQPPAQQKSDPFAGHDLLFCEHVPAVQAPVAVLQMKLVP